MGGTTVKISSRFVGARLKGYETTAAWRDTMNYAAALSDVNPCYLDDERPGGVIAPPMFAVAATWPILERIWEYIEDPDFPREFLLTQVHYTEHLQFYRPIRPGDVLTIRGTIAAIMPHKAGTHIVIRFDAADGKGSALFTEHIGALLRGVACADEGQGTGDLPQVPPPPDETEPVWEAAIAIDACAPFVYDGCTRIHFPIHTSVKFAHDVGLPGIILQGTATLAHAVRELINREGNGNPLAVETVSCRFSGMVLPGGAITVRLLRRMSGDGTGTDLFFEVINAEGNRALSHGYMRLNTA
jgi:acyl dehydratase